MINHLNQRWISVLLSFTLIVTPIIGLLVIGSGAADAGITLGPEINLTPNGIQRATHTNPAIYGAQIVWEDNRNNNLDIYMKDLSTGVETQLTSNSTDQYQPTIFGNRVAWVDNRNGNTDIYIKDLTTGIESAAVSNNSYQYQPKLFGDLLVWQERAQYGLSEVYIMDLTTGQQDKLSASSGAHTPDIWGSRVAWNQSNGGIWEKDLTTGVSNQVSNSTQISNSSIYYYGPSIYENYIAWSQSNQDGNDERGIYVKDLLSGDKVNISNGSYQYNPDIFGTNVVWEDWEGETSFIYHNNLSTGITDQLSSNGTRQRNPDIFGSLVTFEDSRNGTPDIFVKDLLSGAEIQINGDESFIPADQTSGDIDGNTVVWVDNRMDAPGLYYKDLLTGVEQRFKSVAVPPGSTQQWNPRISGNNVVYADTLNEPYGIYLTDLSTGLESPISAGTLQFNPAISGNRVVWEKRESGQIFLREIGGPSGTAISNFTRQHEPDIYGDKIVWSQDSTDTNIWWDVSRSIYLKDLLSNSISVVAFNEMSTSPNWYNSPAIHSDNVAWSVGGNAYLKNLISGTQQKISNNSMYFYYPSPEPAVGASYVVWSGNSYNNMPESDLFLRDVSTGLTMPLSTASGDQVEPRIYGNKVIWTDYRNGNADIFMREIIPNDIPTISGRVESLSGSPLQGIIVNAIPVTAGGETDPGRPVLSAESNAAGDYLISNLSTGDYKIKFEPPPGSNYIVQYYDNVDSFIQATKVYVEPGIDIGDIDGKLSQVKSISGQVLNESLQPISNVPVFALSRNGGNHGLAVTDENGKYYIENLQPGSYIIEFYTYGQGYLHEFYNDKRDSSSADLVEVFDDKATMGIDALLERVPKITGRVIDSNGNPLSNVSVNHPDVPVNQTWTDADGRYDLFVNPFYPPVKIGFSLSAAAQYINGSSELPTNNFENVSGDFNGDGITDVAFPFSYNGALSNIRVPLSNGLSFDAPALWWNMGSGIFDWKKAKLSSGDFNSDGTDDIIVLYEEGPGHSGLYQFMSDGTSFTMQKVWDSGPGGMNWNTTKLDAGDLNGDGRDDVIAFYGDSVTRNVQSQVFLSNGSGFNPPQIWWDSGPGNWDWEASKIAVGDFDGNGVDELATLYGYDAGQTTAAFIFSSSGTYFNAPQIWWNSGPFNWDWNSSKLSAGDANGDGKTDLKIFYDQGLYNAQVWEFISIGYSFSPQLWWDSGGSWTWRWNASELLSGNFDGDPLDDSTILYIDLPSLHSQNGFDLFTMLSNGSSYLPPADWGTLDFSQWDDYQYYNNQDNYFLADIIPVSPGEVVSGIDAVFSWLPDITPPTISGTDPIDFEAGISLESTISATFSEAIDTSTIASSTFYISESGSTATVGATISYDDNSKTANLLPSQPLAYDTSYTVTLTTGITDVAGNPVASDYTFSFKTVANVPLELTNLNLSPNPFDPTSTDSTITFDVSKNADITTLVIHPFSGELKYLTGPTPMSAGPNSMAYDGTDFTTSLLPPSWYWLLIVAQTPSGEATLVATTMVVDYGLPMAITNVVDSPDPFTPSLPESLDISFDQSRDGFVAAVIFDSSINQVREIPLAYKPSGRNSIVWDGRDNGGNIVAPGSYIYVVVGLDSGYNAGSAVGTVVVN